MRNDLNTVLRRVADYAAQYRAASPQRPHRPALSYTEMRERFAAPLPQKGAELSSLVDDLVQLAEPGLGAMTGPRFYGWVIGGTHEAGMAADWLTSTWGQNAGNQVASPAAAAAEEIAGRWLLELLDLPREASVGFVTGATVANFTGLAAARGEVLRRAGWDCNADGLFGAPKVTVLIGEEAHSTIFPALRFLGLGERRIVSIEADAEGRMRAAAFADAMRKVEGPAIAILQAGHINSGAFDPFEEIIPLAREHGAWTHVDGAFGLWARAGKTTRHLAKGIELADSWGTDGHKWLQTPHDSGFVIVRDQNAHRQAMSMTASYLPPSEMERNPADYVPELSRRARGFATWAMIRALGEEGIAQMVDRHCALARRLADNLAEEPGIAILNEVVLNQVAVQFGEDLDAEAADRINRAVIARIQEDAECFVGGALWRGRQIMRVSVINAATGEADIDRSAEAMRHAYRAIRQAGTARAI
ncbi:MAG: aspartate aminotransferase family protein [Alphaproteobacteria bacterium]|nr:aspartate aminotransferase family protein [Alphaproteobacteria bacterium]